jgi:hypothetical protein
MRNFAWRTYVVVRRSDQQVVGAVEARNQKWALAEATQRWPGQRFQAVPWTHATSEQRRASREETN